MIKGFSEQVLNNFEKASATYNSKAELQQTVALHLARECAHLPIPAGFWVDLGAGTGLLADALEDGHPGQKVLRIDGSQGMLARQKPDCASQQWDLNEGLPSWPQAPALLASSFSLHWLKDPPARLQEWITALAPEGWLALAIPVEGSFHQWHQAAATADVHCTALAMPSQASLLNAIPAQSIRKQELLEITQQTAKVLELLKPMRDLGAHTSPQAGLNVGQWRRLEQAWQRCQETGRAQLTWKIQVLLLKR